jgi:hypothetical protein
MSDDTTTERKVPNMVHDDDDLIDRAVDAIAAHVGCGRAEALEILNWERANPRTGDCHDECAEDMRAGLQGLAGFGGGLRPKEEDFVRRGGVVVLLCGNCQKLGRPHQLGVRKVRGRYRVFPWVSADVG